MATKARKYVLRSYFSGFPQREALEIVEDELPPIKDGGILPVLFRRVIPHKEFCIYLSTQEFLCEAQWLSVDPYMR